MIRMTVKSFFTIMGIVSVGVLYIFAEVAEDGNEFSVEGALVMQGIVTICISYFALRIYKKFEGIAFGIGNQPLLDVREAVSDVSFSGEMTTGSSTPILSKYTNEPCLYYHSVVEKWVSRGKKSSWKVIENTTEMSSSYVYDSTGQLLIDFSVVDKDNALHGIIMPRSRECLHSEIDCERVLRDRDPKKEPFTHVQLPEGKLRVNEYILRPDTKVFVHGYVGKQQDGTLLLTEKADCPLIVSRKTQKEFLAGFEKGKALIILSPLCILFGVWMILGALTLWEVFTPAVAFLLGYGVLCFVVVSLCFVAYNRSILLRNRAKNAYANIEGELKRRADIIPQLEQVAKQYVAYEKDMLSFIARLRVRGSREDPMGTKQDIQVLGEAHPDLKSSNVFMRLSSEIIDTEERIAYSRTFYNKSVEAYNTLIQGFPYNAISWLAHQKPMEFFTHT
jgi:LemA protein